MLVQAAETGRDYEHCQALQRRLDDVDSDMRVDDVRIKNMNALADKLIRQGQGDNRAVQQKRDELNQRCGDWRAGRRKVANYIAIVVFREANVCQFVLVWQMVVSNRGNCFFLTPTLLSL